MIVFIRLTVAGSDTGPFNIYSNVDLNTPIQIGISRDVLLTGYYCQDVPNETVFMRVESDNEYCSNHLDIYFYNEVTTTTTTSTSTSTTTTTTAAPTTTTTTTVAPEKCYRVMECESSNYYTIANPDDYFSENDIMKFQIGGIGMVYCGTVTDVDYSAVPTATSFDGVFVDVCGDEIHCNVLPT